MKVFWPTSVLTLYILHLGFYELSEEFKQLMENKQNIIT